jgi:hypothetical protein
MTLNMLEDINKLTIFTVASLDYHIFCVPYVACCLISNPEARVEIAIENIHLFNEKYLNSINKLLELFGKNKFLFREYTKNLKCSHGARRFLEEPKFKSEYTYIGDIDILVCENILSSHLPILESTKLPYSNMVRGSNPNKLSGLHFTKTKKYYPVNAPLKFYNEKTNGEELLLKIIKLKTGRTPLIEDNRIRPVHGFHLSFGRFPVDPTTKVDWGVKNSSHYESWKCVESNCQWKSLFPTFDIKFKLIYCVLQLFLKANFLDYSSIEKYALLNLLSEKA